MKPETIKKGNIALLIFWGLLAAFWIVALAIDLIGSGKKLIGWLWIFIAVVNIVICITSIRRMNRQLKGKGN